MDLACKLAQFLQGVSQSQSLGVQDCICEFRVCKCAIEPLCPFFVEPGFLLNAIDEFEYRREACIERQLTEKTLGKT